MKRNRTRDAIFRCRDFARDTGTQVRLRLVQSSPTETMVFRRCVLTFTPRNTYRQQPPSAPEQFVEITEISRMADHWHTEEF